MPIVCVLVLPLLFCRSASPAPIMTIFKSGHAAIFDGMCCGYWMFEMPFKLSFDLRTPFGERKLPTAKLVCPSAAALYTRETARTCDCPLESLRRWPIPKTRLELISSKE